MCAAKKKDTKRYTEVRNAKALRDYTVEERFEAGIQLKGTEVKSIRAGRAQISDAFGRFEKGELWLYNAHIEEYSFGNIYNHDARRIRKLLLHKHQMRKIAQAMQVGARALIPLRMYFKDSLVKIEVALGVGKKLYDKRADLRKRESDMEVKKAFKYR
ncbi:SsrA-binding protein SmpB [Opitutaceae bacterium TAV4]|uniref:SsrA-binding protein SmpB n=1 Tax=Geminisphaera colitermitum TaxID=1148786 RepID=UPI000158CBB9|nr:SsrA-binding protein SmpB [Geminisphaera colitermitum]RRJ95460.1 SsrA-binding protein SmpB [Opitutaceae bacterium TAV4]RRJ99639.1 SsrA-binding protein SmpB [Opitutaceae bacterium TAV3]